MMEGFSSRRFDLDHNGHQPHGFRMGWLLGNARSKAKDTGDDFPIPDSTVPKEANGSSNGSQNGSLVPPPQIPGVDQVPATQNGASEKNGRNGHNGHGLEARNGKPVNGHDVSVNGNGKDHGEDQPNSERDEFLLALKRRLHYQVVSSMDPTTLGSMSDEQLRAAIRAEVVEFCTNHADVIQIDDHEQLIKEVLDEAFGLGPLEQLMSDATVSDILINGPKSVYVERHGRLERSSIQFHDDSHVVQIVQRIAAQTGRRVDETCPTVDARLPDGSRLNAVIPPIALDGPLVSIRRFGSKPLETSDLLTYGSITEEMLLFISACVSARMNVLVSGGTGSGKTTLLNCLSGFISEHERVATIEDAAELRLQQPHVVRMETRPANVEGEGEISTFDLVRNALRMRPDRIIVGECRGPEALDMLQAMNTGHQGSMTTIHANTPRDAMDRLEMMVGMAGFDIPIWVIRRQVANAINIVVQASRLPGGKRKVVKISEITGTEGDVLSMHDIFEFQTTGIDPNGMAEGFFCSTGLRPKCLSQLEAAGVAIPPGLFERRVLEAKGNS